MPISLNLAEGREGGHHTGVWGAWTHAVFWILTIHLFIQLDVRLILRYFEVYIHRDLINIFLKQTSSRS
jgi:hypothetical protein